MENEKDAKKWMKWRHANKPKQIKSKWDDMPSYGTDRPNRLTTTTTTTTMATTLLLLSEVLRKRQHFQPFTLRTAHPRPTQHRSEWQSSSTLFLLCWFCSIVRTEDISRMSRTRAMQRGIYIHSYTHFTFIDSEQSLLFVFDARPYSRMPSNHILTLFHCT